MNSLDNLDNIIKTGLDHLASLKVLGEIILIFLSAYIVSWLISKIIVRVAQAIGVRSDQSSDSDRIFQLRRIETYLSVITAIIKGVIFAGAIYEALRTLFPQGGAILTTIGASTFIIFLANSTVAPLLRDVTSGATMIIERWFSVGDFVRIVPFSDVAGVVEEATLRSTKIRNINGEVIWLHNQFIQGVRTTPRGVRSLAIDIFVRDYKAGLKLVDDIRKTLPTSPTMLASPLVVASEEQLSSDLWRITIMGQTAPGREWLIEDFATSALKDADHKKKEKVIVYGPLVRYADKTAEKRYGRAVRIAPKS